MCYVRKRKTNKKRRFIAAILAVITIFSIVAIYINKKLDAIVGDIAREQIKNNISKTISDIVSNYEFEKEYINVTYKNDAVSSVGTNAKELNMLKNKAISEVSKAVSEIKEYDIKVSLSNILDDALIFGNVSFSVKAKVIPVYSVECEVRSKLADAGINQTHYSVYLLINVNVSAVLPISTVEVGSVYEICVADMIIVGNVPQICLYGE